MTLTHDCMSMLTHEQMRMLDVCVVSLRLYQIRGTGFASAVAARFAGFGHVRAVRGPVAWPSAVRRARGAPADAWISDPSVQPTVKCIQYDVYIHTECASPARPAAPSRVRDARLLPSAATNFKSSRPIDGGAMRCGVWSSPCGSHGGWCTRGCVQLYSCTVRVRYRLDCRVPSHIYDQIISGASRIILFLRVVPNRPEPDGRAAGRSIHLDPCAAPLAGP